MYEGSGCEKLSCTISGYCRTQIFEFPGISYHPSGDEPHHTIYDAPEVQAYITSELVGYFENSTSSRHYAISPPLRHIVGETEEEIRSQQHQSAPVFIVIEESGSCRPWRWSRVNAAFATK